MHTFNSFRAIGQPPGQTAHIGSLDPREDFNVDDATFQSRIAPNTTLPVTVFFSSEARSITAIDYDDGVPNACQPGGIFSVGVELFPQVTLAGSSETAPVNCWAVINPDTVSETVEVISPPEPGTYDVTIVLRGGQDGEVIDSVARELQVEDEATAPGDPTPPPAAPPDPADPDSLLDQVTTVIAAGAGFLVLLLILQALN